MINHVTTDSNFCVLSVYFPGVLQEYKRSGKGKTMFEDIGLKRFFVDLDCIIR